MSFITARSPVSAGVVFRSLRGSVSVKKDCPSVGISDSYRFAAVRCQRLFFRRRISTESYRFVFHRHISAESYRFVAVRCQRQGRIQIVFGSQGYRREVLSAGRISTGISAQSLSVRVAVRCQRQVRMHIGTRLVRFIGQYGASVGSVSQAYQHNRSVGRSKLYHHSWRGVESTIASMFYCLSSAKAPH